MKEGAKTWFNSGDVNTPGLKESEDCAGVLNDGNGESVISVFFWPAYRNHE